MSREVLSLRELKKFFNSQFKTQNSYFFNSKFTIQNSKLFTNYYAFNRLNARSPGESIPQH